MMSTKSGYVMKPVSFLEVPSHAVALRVSQLR